jgi:hypothetical protein
VEEIRAWVAELRAEALGRVWVRAEWRAGPVGGEGYSLGWSLALSSLRAAPSAPPRHHPPEMPLSRRPHYRPRHNVQAGQPHILVKSWRFRRLEQPRTHLQRKHPHPRHKDHKPHLRPPNPHLHTQLSPNLAKFAPKTFP